MPINPPALTSCKQLLMHSGHSNMTTHRPAVPRKSQTWTRVAIFIASHILLLESLIEWVLVFYLYGNNIVDSKMSPSLALALTASFVTVPLLFVHIFFAWKFNRTIVRQGQPRVFHTVCTYVLRVNIIIWLAASVAGLVVVSQQASCLPDGTDGGHWKVGVSCALHRAVVIVSVISFVTICVYFCSRELCDRPYDVSLLGIHNHLYRSRDGSIRSKTSWDSENTLKNDVPQLRRPDGTYGITGPYWSSEDALLEKPIDISSIQYPVPARVKPELKLSTNFATDNTEYMSGSVTSPNTERPTDERTMSSDPAPFTSTAPTSGVANNSEQPNFVAELAGAAETQQSPTNSGHRRNKSSFSSLRKKLPKSLPVSLPLSADPQIKALSNANIYYDLERKAEKEFLSPRIPQTSQDARSQQQQQQQSQSNRLLSSETSKHQSCPTIQSGSMNQQEDRSFTMSSADAPEVVPGQEQPQKVQRPSTAHFEPPPPGSSSRQSNYQGSLLSVPSTPVMHSITRPLSTAGVVPTEQQQRQHAERLRQYPPRHYSSINIGSRRQSQVPYQFETSQVPRHLKSQSQYHGSFSHFNYPLRHNIGTVPRRHDVEIIYPSTRRKRSSTYGGIGSVTPLDSIKESRASFDEVPVSSSGTNENTGAGHGHIINENTYRGTNWTSMRNSSSG